MFDSIMIEAVCPYCNLKSEIEFQTKDLDRQCIVYRPGDSINEDRDYVETVGACHSPECQVRADKASCTFQKRASGFGALFLAKVRIKARVFTREIFDIEPQEEYTDKYLDTARAQWEPYYKPRTDDWSTELWKKVRR
jgi:hypothetical protein